jgi:multicomponent Na+:H+ antiporter subunit C
MTDAATLYGLCGAALVGIGLYGLIVQAPLLRKILAFNLIGSGVFLLLGAIAERAAPGRGDPVPHALIITGIVVALSATALAVALLLRLAGATGRSTLSPEPPPSAPDERDGG